MKHSARQQIIYYDGACGMCNKFVGFVLRRNDTYLFAPLQGVTAKNLPKQFRNLDTVVLQQSNGKILVKSKATITILVSFGSIWHLAKVLLLIPRPLRDAGYNFIARHRKMSGYSCVVYSANEKKRFLP